MVQSTNRPLQNYSLIANKSSNFNVTHFKCRYPNRKRRNNCKKPTHATLSYASGVFAGSTVYTAVIGALMIIAPRWCITREIVDNLLIFIPLAMAYAYLLAQSWAPDTFSLILPGSFHEGLKGGFNPQFFPELQGIIQLFSRSMTAASLWVHLLAVNLFAARTVYKQGPSASFKVRLAIVGCLTFAPIGILLSKVGTLH